MTIEQLKARPEFVMLGEQQQEFVVAICTNGRDPIKATEIAYATNTDESTKATARRNLNHPVIKKLIADYYGQVDELGSKEAFQALLWRKLQSCTDEKVQVNWATLYMKVTGYESEKAPAIPPSPETEDWVSRLKEVKGE